MKWPFIVGAGLVGSVLAFIVQEDALRRYGLTLDVPERLWIQLLTGWVFLICGLALRRSRPTNRLWRWIVAFALTWIGAMIFTAPLIQWQAIGWAVCLYGILFVVFYAYPTGHLARWEKIAAGAWIGVVALLSLTVVATSDFYGWLDDTVCCPTHLLFIGEDPETQDLVYSVGLVMAAALFLAIVASQVYRWRRSTRVARRSLVILGIAILPLILIIVILPMLNTFSEGLLGVLPELTGGGLIPSSLPDRLNLYLQNAVLMVLPIIILSSLASTRLSHARIGDLVHGLANPMSPQQLETRLRTTLDDRSARLVFKVPATDWYVGVDGAAISPVIGSAVLTDLDERVAIVHDPGVDPELVLSAGTAAAMAIDNARLQAELRAQLMEVQDSRRRLVAATDEARRGVERDLHDGAQQRLVVLSATLKRAIDTGSDGGPELEALLGEAASEADRAIDDLRDLARGVHPAILTQAGLAPAVAGLADRAPIPVELVMSGGRQDAEVEATAYFVISEALANVFKHAGATGARVEVREHQGRLEIEIDDDGSGLVSRSGGGIRGLEDRLEALGGELEIGPSRLGGSRLAAWIPL